MSVTQRGRIEHYAREKHRVPEGWVMDRSARSWTDPQEALKSLVEDRATLVPLRGTGKEPGEHKGYDFATVAESLSAASQRGMFLEQLRGFDEQGHKAPHRLDHFFMAINIKFFTDTAPFKKSVGDFYVLREYPGKAPGAKRVYTCGEKE